MGPSPTVAWRPPEGTGSGFIRWRGSRARGLVALAALVLVVALVSLVVGARPTSVGTALHALTDYDHTDSGETLVRVLRVPRTVVGLLVGGALGLCGTLLQGVMRNPLADPGILGINSGATFAIVLGSFVLGLDDASRFVWLGFAGAGLAGVVVFVIGSMGRGGAEPIKLALAGAAVAALLGSATTMVLLLDEAAVEQFRFWAVGSLATASGQTVRTIWPFIAVGAAIALVLGRILNTLALGDDVARGLGQNVGGARALCGLAIVILAGASVAVAGPIVFVGLAAPHLARTLTGPDYHWILPYSALLGAALLVIADVLGRVVVTPAELPAGIVTALFGAPVLIAFVRGGRQGSL
jgi:iron complex transport system permease protein